ncbi:MAG TPA: MltA domain-containing protein [Albitalea sp.]|uniref:murein transglycosylase A n=1 Tax=Piscinibacter sp. TaxID=1903157 RepID=UPI002ED176C2
MVVACSTPLPPAPAPAPVQDKTPATTTAPSPGVPDAATISRARSRWIAVDWLDLPGWYDDHTLELWPALLRGCDRPPPEWTRLCADARKAVPATDAAAREWLQQRLQPYRVEALDNGAEGLVTGYFEPLVDASRTPRAGFRVPLHLPPADLASRKPYWTRQQLDTQPAAQRALRGRELAYVADPMDALILQIQGSGRLQLTEPDGSRKLVRMAFAAHNEQPYKSVGRWLIEQGELKSDQASWPAIKSWAQKNPRRVNELLWSNPRVVFFREEPIGDPGVGPRGAQGAPLTPGRSIAVDPLSIPFGTPVWLDTTEPLGSAPLRRVVMAQDTGGAITGGVRADFFWGWGEQAEQQAGRMKQQLRMWALWPRTTS